MSEHPEYVRKARLLRAETTEVERLLWSKLNRGQIGGWKFRRQYPIGRYFADFACLEARLVIELDGSQHADDQLVHDESRDAWIRDQGFKIIRFWNIEVQQNLEGVLTKIIEQLESISLDPANPSPQPLPPRRAQVRAAPGLLQ